MAYALLVPHPFYPEANDWVEIIGPRFERDGVEYRTADLPAWDDATLTARGVARIEDINRETPEGYVEIAEQLHSSSDPHIVHRVVRWGRASAAATSAFRPVTPNHPR